MNKQLESSGQRLEGMKEDSWKTRSTMDCQVLQKKKKEKKGINLK